MLMSLLSCMLVLVAGVINVKRHILFRDKELLVKIMNTSIAIIFFIISSSTIYANILWERDLVFDVNTNSSPHVYCINKEANNLFIITKTVPKGEYFHKAGNLVFWDIGASGNIFSKAKLQGADGNEIKTNAFAMRDGSVMASDDLGNLLTIGLLEEQQKEPSFSISVANGIEPNIIIIKPIKDLKMQQLISFLDNTVLGVGATNTNGFCVKLNNHGEIIEQALFDVGQNEIFTSTDWSKNEKPNIVAVGLSFKLANQETEESYAQNFIILYDPNLNMVHEDYFMGWTSMSPFSLMLKPKVCYLEDGNIVVVYNKENSDLKMQLWARCYTPEFKILWDKDILPVDANIFSFDLVSTESGGFLMAVVKDQVEKVEFSYWDKECQIIKKSYYNGLVATHCFNLIRMKNKTIAIFEEYSGRGNMKDITIKAKIIALK